MLDDARAEFARIGGVLARYDELGEAAIAASPALRPDDVDAR